MHRWQIPFLQAEVTTGRRVLYRWLSAAIERSGWTQRMIAEARLACFQPDPPLLAYQTPATELAIALVQDRGDDLLRHRPARTTMERLYGGPAIVQAYRRVLCEQLTRFFELEMLAEAARRELGVEVDLVPDAVRDVDDVLSGARMAAAWAHPHRREARVRVPAWLLALHVGHTWARAGRAVASVVGAAIAPAGSASTVEHARVAIAVVSRAREVPPSRRAAGYLNDEQLLPAAETLYVPTFDPTPAEVAQLRSRGLRVAETGGGAPARLDYLRIALAHAGRVGWQTRAAAELVRTHRQWAGLLSRYRFTTFVSIGDYGIWPVARNVLLAARGIRTVGYSDSGNHGFHAGQDQHSSGYPIPHFAFLRYDAFATWNDRLLRYMRTHAQDVGQYHVIGCQWSDIIASARADRSDTIRRGAHGHGPPGQRFLAVFDSWYHPGGVNTANDLMRFLADILRLLDDRAHVTVVLKKKVPIRFVERDAERIYDLHDRIASHPRARVLPPSADTTEILANSDAVVCFPFTSVAVEAMPAGIPGAFYDASGKLRGWYYDRFPGLFLHGYPELLEGVDRMLSEDAAVLVRRIREAEERHTELCLALGGLGRLRRVIAGQPPGEIAPA